MIAEIKAVMDSAKATVTLVKAAKDIMDKVQRDAALSDIRENLADLQERLIGAQQITDQILEEKRDALRELENEREKNRRLDSYVMIQPRSGVFLYHYQQGLEDPTPPHTACPKCFSEKRVSILQRPDPAINKVECPNCGFSYDPRTEHEIAQIQARADEYYRQLGNMGNYDSLSLDGL